MANGTDVHPQESEFRRRWYEAHLRRVEPHYDQISGWVDMYRAGAAEALVIRDDLTKRHDLERFRASLQDWAQKPDTEGFRGPGGSGLVNSLVKHADDPAATAQLLIDSLSAPRIQESAAQKIDALIEHVHSKKVGGHMVPGHVPFLLSYFWGLEPDSPWPVAWPSGCRFLEYVTAQTLPPPSGERYLRYVDMARELDDDPDRFQVVAGWWYSSNPKPVLLDPVLVERCAFGVNSGSAARLSNAHALLAVAEYFGRTLDKEVSEVLNYSISLVKAPLNWGNGPPRSDVWVEWRIKDYLVGLRLWINYRGVAIAVHPDPVRKGWFDEAATVCRNIDVDGFHIWANQGSSYGEDVGLSGRAGGFVYGRWYEPDKLAGLDLRAEVIEVASAARPVIEALIDLAGRPEPLPSPPLLSVRIDKAAEELLVERSFLYEIVGLLEDKRQVIMYGPPGTGKTYLAKRLAEALAPDPDFRGLVQFHPSTSYEDFFEGYRPVPTEDGGIGYELTRGPLARMAAHAEEHSERHVMVIDEINRANLPRVLGELLFLFEYRGERVSTLYRSDGEFHLPESLWFIGTMNTADRSIALVDAALRRRFHFVPFFPGRGPTVGLLGRWLKREGEPGWVDELVEMVNRELAKYVGEDLQLGFSHFMRTGYREEPSKDDETLRRIWRYSIEPFVEDQLFGDADKIDEFRFEKVIARYRMRNGFDSLPGTSD